MGRYPLMRLVLAARLSQLSRGGETGMDTQDEDARVWAEYRGHTIVGVCADDISGRVSPFKRRQLGPWLTDPKRMAMYDGVLITKIDRLTRKRDWGIREWAEQNNKKILCVFPEMIWPPPPGDTTTAMQWDMLVNQAANEWTNTSERYKRALRSRRDQGYFTGKRPYGYQIACAEDCAQGMRECRHPRVLIPDTVTSAIVRGMVKRYLDGQSLYQIADWLTASAIPPSQSGGRTKNATKWSAQSVKNIIRNPAIIGRVQINGATVHRCEPLISVEHFHQIETIMTGRARGRARPYSEAMLTSILTCQAGHPMYRMRAHKTSKLPNGRYYYYCKQCPKGERLWIWCDEIDGAVNDVVMSMADQPHIITTVMPGDTYGDEIKQLKKEINALDPEDDDWTAKTSALREEIRQLRDKPRKAPKIVTAPDDRSVGEVWESLDTTGQRRWLLARRGSNWLLGQDRARVQCLGRSPEDGTLITVIDLGEFTESLESLSIL